MIGQLRGSVSHTELDSVIVNVAGVGYLVHVSPQTLEIIRKESSDVSLWTYLAVRETSLDLYGFYTKDELDFFKLLITISGIGPKSAIGILSVASIDVLTSAISSGDTSYLTKVSGIGKKSAERIVIELRDKIGSLAYEGEGGFHKEEVEALEALKALGYSHQEAREALKAVPSDVKGTNERIRSALKQLGQ